MVFSKLFKFAVIVLLIFAALYFRTYRLHYFPQNDVRLIHQHAEDRVVSLLTAQVAPGVAAQFPDLTADQRQSVIAQQIKQIKETDREKFEKSVADVERVMLEARQGYFSSRYLSEADPYYYLKLTKNVFETGSLGPQTKWGTFYNPLRYLPNGRWDPLTLHPYLGAGFHWLLTKLAPGIELMTSLSLFPLTLVVLMVPAFFMLGRALKTSFWATALGGAVFILSPILVQRSSYGWYDTDPYNFLFPAVILTTFLFSIGETRLRMNLLRGILSAFLTAFFSLFWAGWAFAFFLILGTSFALIFLTRLKSPVEKFESGLVTYVAAYFIFTLAFVLILISPQGFFETVKSSVVFILKAGGGAENNWPNFFMFIGETNSVAPEKLVHLVSNELTFMTAAIGAGALIWQCFKQPHAVVSRRSIAVFIFSAPLFFLALKAERYVLLFVLPFSLFVVFGVDQIRDWGKDLLRKTPRYLRGEFRRKALVLGVCGLLIIPRTLIGGHVAANISHVIMNDAWYKPLEFLKKTSPQDSIIFSWWSPGHFVTSIAERKVAVDGGAQALRENYWIARAFMSHDEIESLGIFRMLASSGNQAQEWLENRGWPASEAVPLILRLMVLSPTQARQMLPNDWTDSDKKTFIHLTHGTASPAPSYVMVYDDLINNNMLLQMVANWDFKKAESFRAPLKNVGQEMKQLATQGGKKYINRFLQITGQPLPYQVGLKAVRKQGFLTSYENGLVIDSAGPKAFLSIDGPPGKNVVPMNLIYQKPDGSWVEDRPEESGEALLEVVVTQQNHAENAVVAHRDLMPSLLFRLYYFDGKGLDYFRHVISEYEPHTKTKVRIYEIDWQQYWESL